MLSRVADSLYWMARYLERAEHLARVVQNHYNLDLEQPPEVAEARWMRALEGMHLDPSLASLRASGDLVNQLCFQPGRRSSIVGCVMSARSNARQVREMISSEMWETLNRLYHEVSSSNPEGFGESEPLEFLLAVRVGTHLFQGLTDSTMTHGEGWRFIQLGRFLERAQNLAQMLDVHYRYMMPAGGSVEEFDAMEWIGLLKCATAFEAFTKVYTAAIDPRLVAEFLVLNEMFPHALRFSVDRVHESIESIAEISPGRRSTRLLRTAGRLRASLDYAQAEEIVGGALHNSLADVLLRCGEIHKGIYEAFISYPIEATLEI